VSEANVEVARRANAAFKESLPGKIVEWVVGYPDVPAARKAVAADASTTRRSSRE
jgi:hypothetical protein